MGLLWTSDQLVAETSLPDSTQHSQQIHIHTCSGIRKHNLSMRAAADLRLRARGHWDRQQRNEQFTNVVREVAVSYQIQASRYDGGNDGGPNRELTSCSYSVMLGAMTSEENRS